MYVYVGEKKATGNPAERAGLTGGTLYGIKVPGVALEPTNTGIPSGTAFTAANLGNVAEQDGRPARRRQRRGRRDRVVPAGGCGVGSEAARATSTS